MPLSSGQVVLPSFRSESCAGLLAADSVGEVPSVTKALNQWIESAHVGQDRRSVYGVHLRQRLRERLRESGLLRLSIPIAYGGLGGDWSLVCKTARELATTDAELAHVFCIHHAQIAGAQLCAEVDAYSPLLSNTAKSGLFWGGVSDLSDRKIVAVNSANGFYLSGSRSMGASSIEADLLTVSAWHAPTQSALIAALPTSRKGVDISARSDVLGQRHADNGTLHCNEVDLRFEDVLQSPGADPLPQASLRFALEQLLMANLYIGNGLGILEDVRSRKEKIESRTADLPVSIIDDPYVQRRYGELWLLLHPAMFIADEAAHQFDQVFSKGEKATDSERGELSIVAAEALCLCHRGAHHASLQMIDIMGSRTTARHRGHGGFRSSGSTQGLHDPIDYRLRDIGRYVLSGAYPDSAAQS